jgi:hypothetical protein
MHSALALPHQPLNLLRKIPFCLLLRHRSEAREDALAPVLLVDRAAAETIDGDPTYTRPRHATPPVVKDLPEAPILSDGAGWPRYEVQSRPAS